MLKINEIVDRMDKESKIYDSADPLIISPCCEKFEDLRKSGSASIDLRLGTWFMYLREARVPFMRVSIGMNDDTTSPEKRVADYLEERTKELRMKGSRSQDDNDLLKTLDYHLRELKRDFQVPQAQLTKTRYVRFDDALYLHPRNFVLGTTLEWIRMPNDLGGYITTRSSWGRRGLIIATAIGIHPGFKGCLTLELTNLGEIPVALKPGMAVCQMFLHKIEESGKEADRSQFIGKRKPDLGKVHLDAISKKLAGL